jgi:large subunit ribosomal protein L1
MKKRSKRYEKAAAMVTAGKVYSLEEATELVRKFPTTKFNQTVSLSFRLGIDPKRSEQMVRGTCPLPHGSGKTVRVLVFAQGNAAEAARAAGAEYVGYEDLIAKIKDGFLDFDTAIATPDAMTEVRKLGKQLGPRGLMPNPRTGTVSDDPAAAVKAVKAGRAEFKLDKNGNIAAGVGKASFEVNQLVENATSFIEALVRARPPAAKGRFIESCTLASTMSPGLPVDISKFLKV